MSRQNQLTTDEQLTILQLLKKKHRKLLAKGQHSHAEYLDEIIGKIARADTADEPTGQERAAKTKREWPRFLVTLTARTKAVCNLVVAVDPGMAAARSPVSLENLFHELHNHVPAEEFQQDPEYWDGLEAHWGQLAISTNVAPKESEIDFLLSEVTGITALRPPRFAPKEEPEEGAFAQYKEDGKPVLLDAKDKAVIHRLLHSCVGDYRARDRLEECEHEQELLRKIGPAGKRLMSYLHKLPDDD